MLKQAFLAAAISTTLLAGCATTPTHTAHAPMHAANIVDVAKSNPDFSILVEAVVAAGLADTVATTKNITVFAPTNAAFANLLTELGMTKAQLFANKPLLQSVLTYHVLPATVMAKDVKPGMVKTLQGQNVMVTSNGKLQDANGRIANIVTTDIKASNGVVHVIDRVILPKR